MYRMYVDETGSADLKASNDANHRYLGLTGIVISQDTIRHFATPELNRIKREIFNKHDPDIPIVLHRKEIVQKKYPFNVLKSVECEEKFNTEILGLIRRLDFVAMTSVIDKQAHLNKYSAWQQDPYHYCLEILIERFVFYLRSMSSKGDVMAEARGKNEDKRLRECFEYNYSNGTSFVRKDVVQNHLTSKTLKIEQKQSNITGLQIADLIAHPSCLQARAIFNGENFKNGFGAKICAILDKDKYYRSHKGEVKGYGLKWLP